MRRPPRRRDERLVSYRTFVRSYGIIGPVEAALSFLVFFLLLKAGGWQWGQPLAADTTLYGQATGAFLATIIFGQIGPIIINSLKCGGLCCLILRVAERSPGNCCRWTLLLFR